jgi:hypothetical protein
VLGDIASVQLGLQLLQQIYMLLPSEYGIRLLFPVPHRSAENPPVQPAWLHVFDHGASHTALFARILLPRLLGISKPGEYLYTIWLTFFFLKLLSV